MEVTSGNMTSSWENFSPYHVLLVIPYTGLFGGEKFSLISQLTLHSQKLISRKCWHATPLYMSTWAIHKNISCERNFGAFSWKYFTTKINWYMVAIDHMTACASKLYTYIQHSKTHLKLTIWWSVMCMQQAISINGPMAAILIINDFV